MKNNSSISFTVVVPYFKDKLTIQNTLQSISHQTYQATEVIIVDDGSGDPLLDFLCGKYGYKLLRLEKNRGSAEARTVAAKLAKTSHIALLDADDYWFPDHLMTHVTLWDKCGEQVGAISTKMQIVDNYHLLEYTHHFEIDGIRKLVFPSKFGVALSNPFWNSVTTFKTEYLQALNYWVAPAPSYAEDYDLIVRMLVKNYGLGYSPTNTGLYLKHAKSKSNSVVQVNNSRANSAVKLLDSISLPFLVRKIVLSSLLAYIWVSTLIYMARNSMPYTSLNNLKMTNLALYRLLNPIFKNPTIWSISSRLFRFFSRVNLRKYFIFLRREI